MVLTDAMVTKIGMGVGVPIVLIFLFFIIWDLARESKAGRFGTIMMFLVLGGGFISYIIKEVIVFFMERNI
jgi:hypothetical protein